MQILPVCYQSKYLSFYNISDLGIDTCGKTEPLFSTVIRVLGYALTFGLMALVKTLMFK
jgi:hypothetical protein